MMGLNMAGKVSAVVISLCVSAVADDEVAMVAKAEAVKMTSEWKGRLKGDKLSYSVGGVKDGFTVRFSEGTPLGDVTALTLNVDGGSTTIAFKGKVTEKSSVEELRKNLLYVAMDRVATPGLKVPGWEVRPMTSVSSFKKGVSVDGFEDGVLKFSVKGSFFAISGSKKNVLVPADAPMPESAYFRISKPLEFDINFSGKLDPKVEEKEVKKEVE